MQGIEIESDIEALLCKYAVQMAQLQSSKQA
jgi:hypothetical protein